MQSNKILLQIVNKYNNKKTVVDGIKFDSQKEALRYSELKLLEKAGVISRLELQPEFELISNFIDIEGNKYRGVKYKADFQYYDREKRITIVEDVKGMKTEVYLLKKKMFLHKYAVHFREV